MGILRSEAMQHGTLNFPGDSGVEVMKMLGSDGRLQMEDMNARSDGKRPHKAKVQQLDEMERKLRAITEEMKKHKELIPKLQTRKIDLFLSDQAKDLYKLEDVEKTINKVYSEITKSNENNEKIVEQANRAFENKAVVDKAKEILESVSVGGSSLTEPLVEPGQKTTGAANLAGVVSQAEEERLARSVFRASRGNCFYQTFPIEEAVTDPKTGQKVYKSVFWIAFPGGGDAATSRLEAKLRSVLEAGAMDVKVFEWPTNAQAAAKESAKLATDFAHNRTAITEHENQMKDTMKDLLRPNDQLAGGNSLIEDYRLFCIKEKSVYFRLNMCREGGGNFLNVNVWYPKSEEQSIDEKLKGVKSGQMHLTPSKPGSVHESPPTFIKTNELTETPQEVINTYGVPRYQEANPAILTVVTFPFIFGMMYGDVGHGTMLLCAGIWLCKNSAWLKENLPDVYPARFFVVSMGIFSVFAGFMYNDFFCLSIPLFPSRWDMGNCEIGQACSVAEGVDTTNSGFGKGPYPFGLDWAWVGASNELLFVNSMKMKLSVLFGVLQMTVGVFLRWSNAFYTMNVADFLCECVPMLIFMLCFFGWMDFMILYKWVTPMDNPPSIINSLIAMAMGQQDLAPLWPGSDLFAKQLMLVVVATVPVMLFPKPFILLCQHKSSKKGNGAADAEAQAPSGGHGHGEEFEFGEVMIHQVIETIEFVLGTVSHTASYLRIWALSLAHQQLSMVFFSKTIQPCLAMTFPLNGIAIYLAFGAWFGVTVGVLLGMDVLECFLHTLRLHWVEFQSKFYKADGYKFEPYSIRALVEARD